MKKLFSLVMIIFSTCALMLGFNFMGRNTLATSETKDTLSYISLGDSICAGTYLTEDGSEVYENNYTKLFSNHLKTNIYDTISTLNYGKDGDNTSNFYSKITGLDASGNPLDGDALALSLEIQEQIQNADLITISMGANDILGPASGNFLNMLVYGTDITPELDVGLNAFKTNFPKIIERLKTLNPNAKYIFTNIYNPYLELMTASEDLSLLTPMGSLPVTKDALILFGTISEAYINSSSSPIFPSTPVLVGQENKNIEKGINQLMVEYLAGEDNFSYIDTKSAFDAYFLTNGKYDIVECDILSYDGSLITNLNPILDPHPSEAGQALMGTLFKNKFDEKIVSVEFDFNGGDEEKTNEIELYYKNSTLSSSLFPSITKSGYALTGWTIAPAHTDLWTEDFALSTHTTLKAKWTKEHLVIFDTNGGSNIASVYVVEGKKLTRPETNPTKEGCVFAGWYCDFGQQSLPWNFENSIDKNVTIYAKWAYSTYSGNLNQRADNTQKLTFSTVNTDGMTLQWVVNKQPQEGATNSIFEFIAPEKANKIYEIYCLINGQKTNSHILTVGYIVPTSLEIKTIASANGSYRFSLTNAEDIDTNKCVWFVKTSDGVAEVATGAYCEYSSNENFEIYVEYEGNETITSNQISITQDGDSSIIVYSVLGGFVFICAIVLFIFVIKFSKKGKLED